MPTFLLPFLVLVAISTVVPKTHVFWYNAVKNGYHLQEKNPGPGIPKTAVIHEGPIVSSSGISESNVVFDGFIIGAYSLIKRFSTYVWSRDLCSIVKGKFSRVKLRAEYRDSWCGDKPLCAAGPVFIRCGVVDFGTAVDSLNGEDSLLLYAGWNNTAVMFNEKMGFNKVEGMLAAHPCLFEFYKRTGRKCPLERAG